MRTTAVDRIELVGDIRRAVEAGQLVVHLQPIVDLRTLQVEGHEALVRWQHPQRGLLQPARSWRSPRRPAPSCRWAGGCSSGRASRPRPGRDGQIGVNLAGPAAPRSRRRHHRRRHPRPHRASTRARVVLEITESVSSTPRRSATGSISCGPSACGSPSTTSAPGTRRSATSPAARSTSSRSTGPSSSGSADRPGTRCWSGRSCSWPQPRPAVGGEGVETAAQLERLRPSAASRSGLPVRSPAGGAPLRPRRHLRPCRDATESSERRSP